MWGRLFVAWLARAAASGCGEKGPDQTGWSATTRIVNGQAASECEWKWQACLKTPGVRGCWCGGTLISESWVLTAAHCVEDGHSFSIMLGDHNHVQDGDGVEQEISVKRVVSHPSYDMETVSHDFALIELAQEASMNDCVGAACLPDDSMELKGGETCYISGWGTLSEEGGQPDTLQEGEVTIVSDAECGSKYGSGVIDASMLCAQGTRGSDIVDACQGDSGGPLVCENGQGYFEIHGVTSWGYGCADADFPGVWARVTQAKEWIAEYLDSAAPAYPPPTPAPLVPEGEAWAVASGDCVINGDGCLTSPNYPLTYISDQACTVILAASNSMAIQVVDFQVEDYFDFLEVNGLHYTGGEGPGGVVPTAQITWSSDFAVEGEGWVLCLATQTPAPPPTTTNFATGGVPLVDEGVAVAVGLVVLISCGICGVAGCIACYCCCCKSARPPPSRGPPVQASAGAPYALSQGPQARGVQVQVVQATRVPVRGREAPATVVRPAQQADEEEEGNEGNEVCLTVNGEGTSAAGGTLSRPSRVGFSL